MAYLIPRSLKTSPGSLGPLGNREHFHQRVVPDKDMPSSGQALGEGSAGAIELRILVLRSGKPGPPTKLLDPSLQLTLCVYVQDPIEI